MSTVSLQLSIVVDGGKRTVEFSFLGLLKNTLRYTFKSRDLHTLFDRQWHKLSISVQSNIVSIYMDCKLLERRLTDERDGIDPTGRTLITTRVEDGRPVDVRAGQPKLSLSLSRPLVKNSKASVLFYYLLAQVRVQHVFENSQNGLDWTGGAHFLFCVMHHHAFPASFQYKWSHDSFAFFTHCRLGTILLWHLILSFWVFLFGEM